MNHFSSLCFGWCLGVDQLIYWLLLKLLIFIIILARLIIWNQNHNILKALSVWIIKHYNFHESSHLVVFLGFLASIYWKNTKLRNHVAKQILDFLQNSPRLTFILDIYIELKMRFSNQVGVQLAAD